MSLLPPAVADILSWWLPRVRDILGENLHSVMLYGSVTLQDFCAAWSDVDVCTVVRTPVTEGQAHYLGHLHDSMRAIYVGAGRNGWRSPQVIEGAYIPLALVASPGASGMCYVAGGKTRRRCECNPLSAFDRYLLARFGYCKAGAPVAFAPPTPQMLHGQLACDLGTLTNPGLERVSSPVWLAGMLHWMARSLVFWQQGRVLAKSAALEYLIREQSPYAQAFALALAVRRDGVAAAAEQGADLLAAFNTTVPGVAAILTPYANAQELEPADAEDDPEEDPFPDPMVPSSA